MMEGVFIEKRGARLTGIAFRIQPCGRIRTIPHAGMGTWPCRVVYRRREGERVARQRILKHRQTSDGRPNTVPLRSTVRVPDGLRSRRNSTGGLAISNHDRMPSFTSIRESFTHTLKTGLRRCRGARVCERAQNEQRREPATNNGCKF